MAESHTEMRRWHDWTDPDFFMEGRQRERRLLPLFLRQIMPGQMQRTKLTLTGWMLIIIAMGIGSAAYNTASNILFMTLSLLLSSLILSGILSLINFKKMAWELKPPEHLQVGEVGMAEIALTNRKRVFPSMCIAFQVSTTADQEARRLYLKNALSAGESQLLEWTFLPRKRGEFKIYLQGLQSKFPFGFLTKSMGGEEEESLWVWPARVDYEFRPGMDGRRFQTGVSRRNAGSGNDLLNLRAYERGDPPRLIHWKASARMNRLMIRQLAQEGESAFHIKVNPDSDDWSPAHLETLCSLACALSEDLFHSGRIETIQVGHQDLVSVRGLRELHEFFDQLAKLERLDPAPVIASDTGRRNTITFRPCGESGVAIYVDGEQAGQA